MISNVFKKYDSLYRKLNQIRQKEIKIDSKYQSQLDILGKKESFIKQELELLKKINTMFQNKKEVD